MMSILFPKVLFILSTKDSVRDIRPGFRIRCTVIELGLESGMSSGQPAHVERPTGPAGKRPGPAEHSVLLPSKQSILCLSGRISL